MTTNNKMELTAAIQALQSIKAKSDIEIHTDSQYVKNGISLWINNWKKNGWKNAAKKPVANKDLWIALDTCVINHNVLWFWVKGHSGNHYNEIADKLAVKAMQNLE
jgi:ribonuclease HI